MPKPRHRSTHRSFTPKERAAFEKAKREDQAEIEDLRAQGRAMMAEAEAIERVVEALRAARIKRGMSLAEADQITGIGRSNLCRLETATSPNPTLSTLLKLAVAYDVELRVAVVDRATGQPVTLDPKSAA